MGPNELIGTEALLGAIFETGLSEADSVAVLGTVYAFVIGIARNNVEYAQAATTTGVSDEDWWAAQAPFLERAINNGDYPNLCRVSEAGAWDTNNDGFEFGLRCVLDGIEAQTGSAAGERDQAQHRGEASPAADETGDDEDRQRNVQRAGRDADQGEGGKADGGSRTDEDN